MVDCCYKKGIGNMEKILNEKIALITGCDQGIGRSICKLFAEQGATVYANVLKDSSNTALLEEAKGCGGKIIPCMFDIRDKKKIQECIKKIKSESVRLDILVNNAGVKKDGLIEMIDDDSLASMIDVNLIGLIHVTQAALRLMKRNANGACIVNLSSIVGTHGNAGQSVYGATKGAVASLTKSWSKELVAYGIRVNAVAPGSIDTSMFYDMSESKIRESIDAIGMKRLGKPEEVAKVIMFLASDLSSYITGEIVGVDGGLFM